MSYHEKRVELARLAQEVALHEHVFALLAGPTKLAGTWTPEEIRTIVEDEIARCEELRDGELEELATDEEGERAS